MSGMPTNPMWCGREVPVAFAKSIFQFLNEHSGEDIVKVGKLAKADFDFSQEDWEYWLGEWRFVKR